MLIFAIGVPSQAQAQAQAQAQPQLQPQQSSIGVQAQAQQSSIGVQSEPRQLSIHPFASVHAPLTPPRRVQTPTPPSSNAVMSSAAQPSQVRIDIDLANGA